MRFCLQMIRSPEPPPPGEGALTGEYLRHQSAINAALRKANQCGVLVVLCIGETHLDRVSASVCDMAAGACVGVKGERRNEGAATGRRVEAAEEDREEGDRFRDDMMLLPCYRKTVSKS